MIVTTNYNKTEIIIRTEEDGLNDCIHIPKEEIEDVDIYNHFIKDLFNVREELLGNTMNIYEDAIVGESAEELVEYLEVTNKKEFEKSFEEMFKEIRWDVVEKKLKKKLRNMTKDWFDEEEEEED